MCEKCVLLKYIILMWHKNEGLVGGLFSKYCKKRFTPLLYKNFHHLKFLPLLHHPDKQHIQSQKQSLSNRISTRKSNSIIICIGICIICVISDRKNKKLLRTFCQNGSIYLLKWSKNVRFVSNLWQVGISKAARMNSFSFESLELYWLAKPIIKSIAMLLRFIMLNPNQTMLFGP